MSTVGPSQGLTTSDNYLTVVVNGTTIKQLWANMNGSNVKVYQKWKSTTKTSYTNTVGNTYKASARGVTTKVEAGDNSYCSYKADTVVEIENNVGIGRCYVRTYMYGNLIYTSGQLYNSGSINSRNTYRTVYSYSEWDYDRHAYSCYCILSTSTGSSSDDGYGSWNNSQSITVYTPTRTSNSSGTSYSGYTSVSGTSYKGVASTYTVREEDN